MREGVEVEVEADEARVPVATGKARVVVVADALRTWVEMVSSWMVISPGFAAPERVEGAAELI